MKRNFVVLILLLIFCISNLQSGNSSQKNEKKIRLKDGSVIKGTIIYDEVYLDTLVIKNKYAGFLKIPKKGIKYQGTNYNEGYILSYSPYFVKEKNIDCDKGHFFSLSSSKSSDENLSTSFEIDYFYRNFDKVSSRFLRLEKKIEEEYSSYKITKATIDTSLYNYSAHFVMPSIALRFSILPNFIQEMIKQYNLFPYIGGGIGYNFACIRYNRITNEPLIVEGEEFTNDHIADSKHIYGGLLYKIFTGISLKISTKCVLNMEIKYYKAKFAQFLSDEEKSADLQKETFNFNGICPSFGIRFGLF